MATYDGDITLSVNVKAGDVKTAALDVQQEIEEIFNSASKRDSVSDAFQRMQVNAASLYDKLGSLQARMESLELKGKAVDANGNYTAEYDELVTKLNDVTNRATITKNKLQELNVAENITAVNTTPVAGKFEAVVNILRNVGSAITSTTGKFGTFISGLKNVATFAKNTAGTLMQLGSHGIKTAIAGLSKTMKLLTNNTNKHNNALQMGFKNFIRYGLGVRSIFALINKLRRALMEGLGNLAQYSSPFNAIMSQFVSSLATLQNAFATAFAPILTVVLPILSALMDALIRVITLIGQFFAALTGKGTFVQAKRVNKDYAGSLAGVGKSAGGASKGMNKANKSAKELERTISGFDDVEILHENKPTSSGSGGGAGGGGGGGVGGLNPNDMFETVEIESPIADMANRIRELIANQDWVGLGVFLGEKVNSIFRKAKELISWDNLGARIAFGVRAITTTINSLVATVDWDLIGSTFAEGLNTIVKTLNLVITGINWRYLGAKLATGINALFRDVNWEDVGQLLANSVNAVFDFLYNAISTFDWKQAASSLTTAVNKFIQKTDWKQVGKTLSALFKGVLQLLFQALGTFDWNGLGQAFLELLSGIDWSGLLNTFVQGVSGTFGVAFRTLAGILSRIASSISKSFGSFISGLMNSEGGNVVSGFLNGILAGIAGIGEWIKTNIVEPFISGFEGHFEISSPSKLMEREGGFIIAGLYEGISEKWKSIKAFFSGGIKGIVSTFKETDWKGSGSTIIEKVKGGASGAWSTISSFFSRKTTDTKEQFTRYNWKPAGTTIVSGVRSGAQSVWTSKISEYFNSAIQGIKNKFLNSNWSPSGQKIITGIKSGITSKYGEVTSKINDLVSAIKNKFNNTNWKSIGENICSGIKSGISKGWSWVTDKARELAGAAYEAARKKLDINSPSKLFRDKIGSSISEGMAVGIEEESDSVISAVRNLTNSITNTDVPQLEIPSIALGKVIPPETSKNIDTLNETMKTLMDVLKYTQTTAVTKDELITILNTLLPTMLQRYVSFYIGDEQIARHANAGNSKLDYRFNPVRS